MSRNDLFASTWTSASPPPRFRASLGPGVGVGSSSTGTLFGAKANTNGLSTSTSTPSVSPPSSASASTSTPKRPPPPPIHIDNSPLSPLHQSPTIVHAEHAPGPGPRPVPGPSGIYRGSTGTGAGSSTGGSTSNAVAAASGAVPVPAPAWKPPLPHFEDVELRFVPSDTYLLGEGRYGRVYLSAYRAAGGGKVMDKGKERASDADVVQGSGTARATVADADRGTSLAPHPRSPSPSPSPSPSVPIQVNSAGDGFTGGTWRLCASKRLAPDRQSQTMGLREAFFLNRLQGCVYVVKLLAVKEDVHVERRHSRSVSDAPPPALRSKDDTIAGAIRSGSLRGPSARKNGHGRGHGHGQGHGTGDEASGTNTGGSGGVNTASLSRLTLILEHAPLGTLDRLLRSSPHLVTRAQFLTWANQAASALLWAHTRGVVHADIKPANLLLTSTLDLRLSDFGSSLLVHPAHPPLDGAGLGTLPFSAPELVDPSRPFAFPADVFSLGASLYMCLTGFEPYRGLRAVEMMHHVRRGGLWAHEERQRLHRIGNDVGVGVGVGMGNGVGIGRGSPYPSAWRDEGVQRGGSLRVRPKLSRMPSAESLRASDDIVSVASHSHSPSGVKLWAKWAHREPSADAVSALLAEEDQQGWALPPPKAATSTSPMTPAFASSEPPSPVSASTPASASASAGASANTDMTYLDGEVVAEGVRVLLQRMLAPDPADRPTASELVAEWTLQC